jgi:hypothetical protein
MAATCAPWGGAWRAARRGQGAEGQAVGLVQLTGAEWLAGRHELVTRGEDDDLRDPSAGDARPTAGDREPDLRGAQAVARAQDRVARAQVVA